MKRALPASNSTPRRGSSGAAGCVICGALAVRSKPDPLCDCCHKTVVVYYPQRTEEQVRKAMERTVIRARRIAYFLGGAGAMGRI